MHLTFAKTVKKKIKCQAILSLGTTMLWPWVQRSLFGKRLDSSLWPVPLTSTVHRHKPSTLDSYNDSTSIMNGSCNLWNSKQHLKYFKSITSLNTEKISMGGGNVIIPIFIEEWAEPWAWARSSFSTLFSSETGSPAGLSYTLQLKMPQL